MKFKFKYRQYGFDGKKGVAAITLAQTPDGRLGFFHQHFSAKTRSRSIRGKFSQPIYIDGELTPSEVRQVKAKFSEQVANYWDC